jgi:hypothetical protein
MDKKFADAVSPHLLPLHRLRRPCLRCGVAEPRPDRPLVSCLPVAVRGRAGGRKPGAVCPPGLPSAHDHPRAIRNGGTLRAEFRAGRGSEFSRSAQESRRTHSMVGFMRESRAPLTRCDPKHYFSGESFQRAGARGLIFHCPCRFAVRPYRRPWPLPLREADLTTAWQSRCGEEQVRLGCRPVPATKSPVW